MHATLISTVLREKLISPRHSIIPERGHHLIQNLFCPRTVWLRQKAKARRRRKREQRGRGVFVSSPEQRYQMWKSRESELLNIEKVPLTALRMIYLEIKVYFLVQTQHPIQHPCSVTCRSWTYSTEQIQDGMLCWWCSSRFCINETWQTQVFVVWF